MQGWGAVQPDEWRAQGLTDRLTMPHSKVSPCWEDLTQPYDWGGGVSSPLHSALSSSDCLPRACGKDGSILPPLATLLPEPAADVPLVAPPKKVPVGLSSKRSSSKGSRGSRKAVGRMNAKVRHPTACHLRHPPRKHAALHTHLWSAMEARAHEQSSHSRAVFLCRASV